MKWIFRGPAPRRGSLLVDTDGSLEKRRSIDRLEYPLRRLLRHVAPGVKASDYMIRNGLLTLDERVVGCSRSTLLTDLFGGVLHPAHEWVGIGEHLVLQPQRMHAMEKIRALRRYRGADKRLRKGPIQRKIDFRYAGRRCEAALIGRVIAAKRADVLERPCLAPHHPIPGHQVGIRRVAGLVLEHGLVQARRKAVDKVDVARKLTVLLLRNAAGNKDAQVPDRLMNGVDDCLPVGSYLVDVLV